MSSTHPWPPEFIAELDTSQLAHSASGPARRPLGTRLGAHDWAPPLWNEQVPEQRTFWASMRALADDQLHLLDHARHYPNAAEYNTLVPPHSLLLPLDGTTVYSDVFNSSLRPSAESVPFGGFPFGGFPNHDDWRLLGGLSRTISTDSASGPLLGMQRYTPETSSESGLEGLEATLFTPESLENDTFWDTTQSQQGTVAAAEADRELHFVHEYSESARGRSSMVQAPQSSIVERQPPHSFHFLQYDPESQEYDSLAAEDNARGNESHARPVAKRRGRPSERGETCIRCKRQNKKCKGGTPCDTCRETPRYATICVPADFTQARALKRILYHTRVDTLRRNILEWVPSQLYESPTPIVIEISNGFDASFPLEVQEYIPNDSSLLVHTVFRGLEAGGIPPQVPSTAFGIKQDSLTNHIIDSYLDTLIPNLIQHVANKKSNVSIGNLISSRALAYTQLSDAQSEPSGKLLVQHALRFWAIQMLFFESQWDIVRGGALVGMAPCPLPGYWHGITFLPRLINQQLDARLEQRQDALEAHLLAGLERLLHPARRGAPPRDTWYPVFLASYLLLHGLETDSWNLHAWAQETGRRGGTPWPLANQPLAYHVQNEHLAAMVAAHFKCAIKGHAPLALDWTRREAAMLVAHDAERVAFMRRISSVVHDEAESARLKGVSTEQFVRSDAGSLEGLFTAKLLLA